MNNDNQQIRASMDNRLFKKLSDFIYTESGIRMPMTKKTMLEARLHKRLRAIGIDSFDEYCSYLFSPEGIASEVVHMIDVVSTNKTDFFREGIHFEYLVEQALPDMINSRGSGIRRPFLVWSAACSSGEEAYTLAMVLDAFSKKAPGFEYMVLGTDISTRVLETARDGIYNESSIEPVPDGFKNAYLMHSKDRSKGMVRIVPELRTHVRFRQLNFMAGDFGMREKQDVIFCRNVLIYFDQPTQERVLKRLCSHLSEGGYLFTGHSETLNGMDLPIEPVANTISKKVKGPQR